MANSVPIQDNFQLKKLEIVYNDGRSPLDLSVVFQSLEIYEDIFANSVSGKIVIYDTGNIIQNGPILGFEKVNISFQTPNKIPFSGIFQIYNILNREPVKERSNVFTIEFCSREQFLNSAKNIGKGYSGVLISDIASDIQTNTLSSSFNLIETTKFLQSIIIPLNWRPFDAINWLSTRANSTQYSGANYLYFQNKNGYNFVSVEKLVDVSLPAIDYFYGPANIRKESQVHANPTTESNLRNIKNYSIISHINLLDNLSSGMYSNRVQTYDFLNKKFTASDFNYSSSYSGFKHLEDPNKYNKLTQNSGSTKLLPDYLQNTITPPGAQRFYPDSISYQFPNNVMSWLSYRISQLQEINNIKLNIEVSGDSERTVGEVVNVYLPSNQPINNLQILDNYFQGKFLITSLKHMITQEKYITSMELCKDSLFSASPY